MWQLRRGGRGSGSVFALAVVLTAGLAAASPAWGLDVGDQVPLAVEAVGPGSVTSDVGGIDCGSSCLQLFNVGDPVTLTATPAAHATFTGWSGDCTGSDVCRLTMDGAKSASASFAAIQHVLSVSKAGAGTGAVTGVTGIDCGTACSTDLDEGSVVTLTATPDAGSTFAGWSGAGCAGTSTCEVTMSDVESVVATFDHGPRTLTVSPAGDGSGSVASDGLGEIFCGATCSHDFTYGTVVTLTATPAAHSTFSGWSGACTGGGTCQVTTDDAKGVTATFAKVRHALTVSTDGTGSGTVSSTVLGSDCDATCLGALAEGDVVTLTASPDAHSTFTSWSGGGCSGTAPCQVPIDGAKTVTATFADVVGPAIVIAAPTSGAHYPLGASVKAGYACADDHLATCQGTVPTGHNVDTSTAGVKSFTVTASDQAGNPSTKTISYTVDPKPRPLDLVAPSLNIHSPVYGGTYLRGVRRKANFWCRDNPGGSGLALCAGTKRSGAPIDTRTTGPKLFWILARDRAGNEVGIVIPYTVEPSCTVPQLRASSLGHARHLLARARCALGRVLVPRWRPGHSRGRLVVASQSPHAGRAIRRAGTRVSVRLRRIR
ncbi:MAG: large repetitive protein [Solirubrobacteraceae bacterium]|nr:large repetitive protein [Solirubrobacteraceae bacterium]